MDEIYEEDEDINPDFDDIALGSPIVEEHCGLLRRTLLKARKANLKFNVLKTQLSQTSVNYLGHVLSDEGIKPDPKKIRAIEEFVTPNCKEDLQRFLGMVTYLAKFTPHLLNLTHNLRQLLKKDSVWIWDTNTERDFKLVKQAIMKSPCLKYFNGNKAVTVSVDANKTGLGAVLLQEGQPVAYGSVSLTQTQQRYAQIEKELMAVIYGLEHFNYYTYGRIVTVQTDHKPILCLSKKPYDTISLRLQRMLLRLNKYNIQLEYVPGKNLVIADALSRAQSTTDNFDEVLGQEVTVRINLLTQASPNKWEEIASLTAGDPEMQDVLFHINNGWPQKKKTKIAAQPYWHCKEELYSTKEGIICRGQRLVVPVKHRKEILKLLHVSHKGIVSSKIKAREYFYWPNLNRDVEEYVSKCKICQKYQRENQKEILINPEIPGRPWQKVA
ncbi:retrovirus-related Pol polyprotein from transposon 17.6 [Trichonephila inaurata madagascariensis]|nr:retrovirus-related Pol polyprotein from transposon 17.6 [Trichonephila inaurata madagascariensis]